MREGDDVQAIGIAALAVVLQAILTWSIIRGQLHEIGAIVFNQWLCGNVERGRSTAMLQVPAFAGVLREIQRMPILTETENGLSIVGSRKRHNWLATLIEGIWRP